MLRLGIIYQRAVGLDLYTWKSPFGASLQNCVAFVLPYAKGQKTHPEYVHTKVKFDIERAQNHEKGHAIGAKFEPRAALHCLELAEFYDPSLRELVGQLAKRPGADYPTIQILLNQATRP